ncbi:MAG TPA: hypothetical protein VM580_04055 [Labilithrix sp.]|nr:hypothetical protein [Labilithrix sp.]
MSTPAKDKTRIGDHEIWFEPDTGFVFFVHNGVINLADAHGLVAYLIKKSAGEPIFFLANSRNATGFTPEARKVLATSELIPVGVSVSSYGAPLVIRVVVTLLEKATAVVPGAKVVAYATSEETAARAWLTERRQAYLRRKSSGWSEPQR